MIEKKKYRPLSEVIDDAVEQLVAAGVIEGYEEMQLEWEEQLWVSNMSRFTSRKRIEEQIEMLDEFTGEEMSTQEHWDWYDNTFGKQGE